MINIKCIWRYCTGYQTHDLIDINGMIVCRDCNKLIREKIMNDIHKNTAIEFENNNRLGETMFIPSYVIPAHLNGTLIGSATASLPLGWTTKNQKEVIPEKVIEKPKVVKQKVDFNSIGKRILDI